VLDFSFKNSILPGSGKILLSDPFLDEDYFRRSVVLICNHNDDGTFGFVLNNYIDLDLHSVDENFPDLDVKISIGGPVETDSLFYIHEFQNVKDSFEIIGGLFFGGDYNDLIDTIAKSDNKNAVRFFLGYSGWAPQQLDEEIATHSWIVAENISKHELLDTQNQDLWKFFMEKQGGRFKTIANSPLNPNNN
jgi:putative transcriptional regulator